MSDQPVINLATKQTDAAPRFIYSVCTLVSNLQEYLEMMQSFITAGFDTQTCEYRYIDNSSKNTFDGYSGLNLFLREAQGEYIILCHQDILLNFDNRKKLDDCIADMSEYDQGWAILTNAGGIENDLYKRFALNVAYPNGRYDRRGPFPQKIMSADENFIVVKRSANLALSGDLHGFHLYGTDLCLIADLLGYSAYVIDFKLTHKSRGNPDESYASGLSNLVDKYKRFITDRRIVTTITDFYLSGSDLKTSLVNTKWGKKIARHFSKPKTKSDGS